MRSAAFGPPNVCVGCSREGSRSLRLQESVTEHSIMSAHIRLVSSEAEERAGLDGEAIAVDEAPVGLPEEAGADKGRPAESRRDEMLGEAAPPLVAEPEDRAGGPGGRERPKGALARLIAFARPRKAKAAAAIIEAGSAQAAPEDGAGARMGASVRKAPSQSSSPSLAQGRRKPLRRSWKLRAPKPSPIRDGFGQAGGRARRGRHDCRPGRRGDRGRRTGRNLTSGARGQQRPNPVGLSLRARARSRSSS